MKCHYGDAVQAQRFVFVFFLCVLHCIPVFVFLKVAFSRHHLFKGDSAEDAAGKGDMNEWVNSIYRW